MVAKGIDMEALSPRDANAQRPPRVNDLKTKATAQLKANKEKEHPPPPPPYVTEPPSTDCKDGNLYQVGKLLGKGGFAVCYEGQPAGARKKYALKIVKSQMQPKMEQKFQTELQIHSKMRHQNIVQFHRAFSFENSTYLVLELCPNASLMDMVKRRKGLTEPEVRFYAVQIAGAIKYMHLKGIIHRDLKMGNIFLDKNMNAKIGDFGLAALVVTGKDMQTIRRTTLCGTPNYIAPEILEKGRKGHDHMVDIWSLGIIMFAMLTSKPPFQSTTTDEIYRRARDRDYEWPTLESSNKIISQEAKDLVATMLEDADRRPDPDEIVQDVFFYSGYLPVQGDMTPRLRETAPDSERFYNFPRTDYEKAQNRYNLKEMCKKCGVGPWNETQLVHKPVWKEMAGEEAAGLTPIIPLAEGIVYRPFDEWVKKEAQLQRVLAAQPPPPPAQPSAAQPPTKSDELSSTVSQKLLSSSLRAPPQSFAAQQRAQNRPPKSIAPVVQAQEVQEQLPARQAAATLTRGRAAKKEAAILEAVATPTVRLAVAGQSVEAREQAQAQAQAQSQTVRGTTRSTRRALPSSRTEPTLASRRADGDQATTGRASKSSQQSLSLRSAKKEPVAPPAGGDYQASLFGPSERREPVPGTRPEAVLERLRRLQSGLERALNARSMALVSSRDSKAPPSPPRFVVKWVDYTNKFGLGYILNDGSIGCLLRDMATSEGGRAVTLPPACILVRDAERHIRRKNDPAYADRQQIVPMSESICFYENYGEEGLALSRVDPRGFRVPVGPDGVGAKMSAGRDAFEHRKRERIVLWKKFATYMLAFGRELESSSSGNPVEDDPPIPVPTLTDPTALPDDVITFYQRFGDVGCWVFGDGHVQFNYPDHTKIVLDASGTWCHFWHLPQDAAEDLARTGSLKEASLDERTLLSYPVQTLLNFSLPSRPTMRSNGSRGGATSSSSSSRRCRPEISADMQGIPAANDFRRKIEFIRDVVREWVDKEGVGRSDMSRERRLRWLGHREVKMQQQQQQGAKGAAAAPAEKHVWVTIGARGGDQRHTALVDPRRPGEIGPDVDESRKPAGGGGGDGVAGAAAGSAGSSSS